LSEEVARCPHCDLVQYLTEKETCRRCKKPFVEKEAELEVEVEQPAQTMPPVNERHALTNQIAARVLLFRRKLKLTQLQLAKKLGCTRTYISKIECGHCLPNIDQVLRLQVALKITMHDLLVSSQELRGRELLSDPFLAEIAKGGKGLSSFHWTVVVATARKYAENPSNRREEQYAKQR
jgi:transcriptional regulator with XRE-family HTH domain